MSIKETIANETLSKQLTWIAAADSKVPPVFAISTAMLGVIVALISALELWTIGKAISCALTTIPLVGSIVSLALATFPRLKGPKGSLIYFGGIVTKSADAYVQEMLNATNENLEKDVLLQAHRNAEIAQEKYNCVKWAMVQVFVSFPFWLLSIFLLYK